MVTSKNRQFQGFTIVELLIVVVIIAILAAITIIVFNGITGRARDSSVKADITSFAKVLENEKTVAGTYPATAAAANGGKGLVSSGGNSVSYNVDGTYTVFCLQVSRSGSSSYFVTNGSLTPVSGTCSGTTGVAGGTPIADGVAMQTVTTANCPATRTRALDARDNRTYWIQKLADNKCWMLTNLAYAGGGTNTYSDTKTLTNGTGGSASYTVASYYVPTTGSNVTTEPTAPSTSTDGGATNPQYGYLYNWCGAMGGQATAACANATTPAPVTTTSVCPAGWRLPTGNSGEWTTFNTAVNGGLTNTDAGLRTNALMQWSGSWNGGFSFVGTYSLTWSSTQSGATSAYNFWSQSGGVTPDYSANKDRGYGVRCIAV